VCFFLCAGELNEANHNIYTMLKPIGAWKTQNHTSIYTPSQFEPTPNVAVFSLRVLIKIQPKIMQGYRRPPLNANAAKKWQWAGAGVVGKLQEIFKAGASIAVIESASPRKRTSEEAKTCFVEMQKSLKIPVFGIFSHRYNRYRKPFTGPWELLASEWVAAGSKLNKSKSIICGRAAGRHRNGMYPADMSSCDRAFASNVNVTFVTERLFSGGAAKKWRWLDMSMADRRKYMERKEDEEPDVFAEAGDMAESRSHLIMIVGPPACGKTLLARRLVEQWKENGLDISRLTEKAKAADLDALLDDKKSVILEGRFARAKQRKKFLNAAAKNGVPVLIVRMTTPLDLCALLSHIRVQTSDAIDVAHLIKKYVPEDPHRDLYKNSVDLSMVRCIDYPMVVRERKEYWLHYT